MVHHLYVHPVNGEERSQSKGEDLEEQGGIKGSKIEEHVQLAGCGRIRRPQSDRGNSKFKI